MVRGQRSRYCGGLVASSFGVLCGGSCMEVVVLAPYKTVPRAKSPMATTAAIIQGELYLPFIGEERGKL